MAYTPFNAAATSSWVLNGLEAHSATSAPPAANVRMRLAVSVVTCMHAAMRKPAKGFVRDHSSRMATSTGMFCSAHSMRRRPCSANVLSLQSPRNTSIPPMPDLSQARGPPQQVGFVRPLPRQVHVVAAEMAVGRGLPVNGPPQIQIPDNRRGPQIKMFLYK